MTRHAPEIGEKSVDLVTPADGIRQAFAVAGRTQTTRRLHALRARRAVVEGPDRAAVRRRNRTYRRALASADALAAGVSFYVAVVLLGNADALKPASLLALPVAVISSKAMKLYDRDELVLRKSTLEEAPALFQLATLYALVTWLLQDVLVDGALGRKQVLGLWAFLWGTAVLARALAREVARRATPVERCLVIGDQLAGHTIRHKLEGGRRVKATIVGCLSLQDASGRDGEWLIAEMVRAGEVERVLLAPSGGETDAVLNVIRVVKSLGPTVSVLPRMFEAVGSSVVFDDLYGMTVLGIRRFGLSPSSRALKRATDVVGGSVLLLTLAPFLALIAMAIRIDSPGPVLFRQWRVGRNGERFRLLKFRTMVDGADAMKAALSDRNESDGLFKIAQDPRITRVGQFLRRMSLDELPQLLNVLRGEMSLVGPRPLIVDEDQKTIGWHRGRLQLTPGMTGQWQILGSSRIPLHEMVAIDYLYVANWSFWADVKIMLRTIPYVLGRQGM
jgi:exopolysaccharide biosynthesis polyprenyl glycosylphosphotransferase